MRVINGSCSRGPSATAGLLVLSLMHNHCGAWAFIAVINEVYYFLVASYLSEIYVSKLRLTFYNDKCDLTCIFALLEIMPNLLTKRIRRIDSRYLGHFSLLADAGWEMSTGQRAICSAAAE